MSVKNIRRLTDNKFLNMYSVLAINNITKKEYPYFIASRKEEAELTCITKDHTKCDAVMIVPIYKNGDVVFIKQYRPAVDDYLYEMPAGLVDPGETIEEAVTRELYEETGLETLEIQQLIKPSYTSAGMSDESIAIYLVKVDGEPTTEYNEGNEDIEVVVVKLSDIENFVYNNNVAAKASLCAIMIKTILNMKENR